MASPGLPGRTITRYISPVHLVFELAAHAIFISLPPLIIHDPRQLGDCRGSKAKLLGVSNQAPLKLDSSCSLLIRAMHRVMNQD